MIADGRNKTLFRGSTVALVTPFDKGKVDTQALRRLVDRQIDAGTDVLLPCGTTGESPTLTTNEKSKVIETVLDQADGRCRVLAGTGSNSTAGTIQATRQAAALGVDGVLLVAPYYNMPTQQGLYEHYAAVARAVDVPVVLYNIPKRSGVAISEDTIIRLSRDFGSVRAVKHATGSVDGVDRLLVESDIDVLSGDDGLNWPLMALGATGAVSMIANLAPELIKSQVDAAFAGDLNRSRTLHRKVALLTRQLCSLGPNPIPVKSALALAGQCSDEFRLPLCPLGADDKKKLQAILRQHELL